MPTFSFKSNDQFLLVIPPKPHLVLISEEPFIALKCGFLLQLWKDAVYWLQPVCQTGTGILSLCLGPLNQFVGMAIQKHASAIPHQWHMNTTAWQFSTHLEMRPYGRNKHFHNTCAIAVSACNRVLHSVTFNIKHCNSRNWLKNYTLFKSWQNVFKFPTTYSVLLSVITHTKKKISHTDINTDNRQTLLTCFLHTERLLISEAPDRLISHDSIFPFAWPSIKVITLIWTAFLCLKLH